MSIEKRMDEVAAVITAHRYVYRSETDLQQQLADLLTAHGHTAVREWRLDGHDRIDMIVGGYELGGHVRGAVGMEVKVAGSEAAALRQVTRYAKHPAIGGLLLVTTRTHRVPATLSTKPVRVVSLLGNGLA